MTLLEIRAAYPRLFNRGQSWFIDEPFMRAFPNDEANPFPPTQLVNIGAAPAVDASLPLAVDLAAAYVLRPTDPIWKNWIWCRDVDRIGQRIYVGKTEKGFEIHRHLHLDEKWGTPSWGSS